jgi:hypothetical protein
MLLPLSHPTFAIPIANVRLLRPPLVFVQQGQQFPFLWFPFHFDQLSYQLRILLLRSLEYTHKGFKERWFLRACHHDLHQARSGWSRLE